MEHKFKGLVLELQTTDKTELDEKSGVEIITATYYQLHGFEYGRKYPEIVRIKLKQAQVAAARLLIGHVAEISLDEFKGKDFSGKEYTNYNFVSGLIIQEKKAA